MVLNAMREGAKSGIAKFVLFGLMVLAVFGLVLTDVGGFFRGGVGNSTVAKIGRSDLGIVEFDRTVRSVLSRQGLDVQMAYELGFINQILNAEIGNNLLYRAADDAGVRVSDSLIVEQIDLMVAPYVASEMTAKDAFLSILRNQGMTEAQFVTALRTEMANTVMRNAVQMGLDYVPSKESRDLYRFQNEERTVKIVSLPHSAIQNIPAPQDAVLQAFYQAGKERYAIPETRRFTIAVLSPDSFAKTLDIDDAELEKLYQQHIDDYTLPEQRTVEQAVLSDQSQAERVAEQTQSGAALAAAVKDVTGKDEAYLGTDKFQQGGLASEIGDDVFAAETGAVIGPIKTALGWHVLVLKEISAPTVTPFADVKDRIRQETLQTQLSDQLYEASSTIDDELAAGTPLEDIAETLELEIKSYGPVLADGTSARSADAFTDFAEDQAAILKTVFSVQDDGESAPVIELSKGRYAAIRVDTINEKSHKPFEDVKDDLAKIWQDDQRQVMNKERADNYALDAQNGTRTLEAIAQDAGRSVQTITIKRSETDSPVLTPQALQQVFAQAEGDIAVTSGKDGFVIAQVTGIRLPPADAVAAGTLSAQTDTLRQASQSEAMQSFLSYLNNHYKVRINQRLIDTTYGTTNEAF